MSMSSDLLIAGAIVNLHKAITNKKMFNNLQSLGAPGKRDPKQHLIYKSCQNTI